MAIPAANRNSPTSVRNQHKPTKQARSRIPPPQRIRIMQKYVAGKSVVQISREEKRNRETVTNVVRSDEMQTFVRAMRERLYGLASDALAAIQYSLQEQMDGRLAFQLLFNIGVIPSERERETLLREPVPQNSERERVKQIMSGLIEGVIARAAAYDMRQPELEADLRKVGGRINYNTGRVEPLDDES